MEQLVHELRQVMPFKESTEVGDIVLIVAKEPQMLVFARVGAIERDPSRKEEWWHVTLHFLSVPLQAMVWTLRTPQLTGQEIFTMGGDGRFIKALRFDGDAPKTAGASARDGQAEPRRGPVNLRVIK